MPRYRIELFQLTMQATPDFKTVYDAMKDLCTAQGPLVAEVGAYIRELSRLKCQGTTVRGSFRKFRDGDLPERGKVGGRSAPIELEEGEALVERNFFTLYRHQSLLLWHTNRHASAPSHFEKALAEILGTKVSLSPLIEGDALKRLMQGGVVMKSLKLSIPRPKNPDYYPSTDFNKSIFSALAATDGDRIIVEITTDGRMRGPNAKLKGPTKAAVKEIVNDDLASSAKVVVVDDDGEHPINLIADRLLSHVEIDHEGRYPPAEEMFRAFDEAKAEHQGAIDACLGGGIR